MKISDKKQKENKERLVSLLKSTERNGIDKLLSYLEKSDFYTAPASTRFHGSCPGGLLQHSLNVYDCLCKKAEEPFWKDALGTVPMATLIVVALLHDLCKISFYEVYIKNVKVYSDTGSKSDAQGRYDWEAQEAYTVNDRNPYGHGEKSVMMAETFIKLSMMEKYAIRWHMGFSEPKENYGYVGASMEMYPLVLALHEADLEASHILEKEEKSNG